MCSVAVPTSVMKDLLLGDLMIYLKELVFREDNYHPLSSSKLVLMSLVSLSC